MPSAPACTPDSTDLLYSGDTGIWRSLEFIGIISEQVRIRYFRIESPMVMVLQRSLVVACVLHPSSKAPVARITILKAR